MCFNIIRVSVWTCVRMLHYNIINTQFNRGAGSGIPNKSLNSLIQLLMIEAFASRRGQGSLFMPKRSSRTQSSLLALPSYKLIRPAGAPSGIIMNNILTNFENVRC